MSVEASVDGSVLYCCTVDGRSLVQTVSVFFITSANISESGASASALSSVVSPRCISYSGTRVRTMRMSVEVVLSLPLVAEKSSWVSSDSVSCNQRVYSSSEPMAFAFDGSACESSSTATAVCCGSRQSVGGAGESETVNGLTTARGTMSKAALSRTIVLSCVVMA